MRSALILLGLLGCHATVRDTDASRTARLDAFATRALAALKVPGAAIAVIADGEVIYERVLGVKQLGESAAITPHTRFLLASATKPLTTRMQQALVDAQLLAWETPMTELWPSFVVDDPQTTQQLQLWHSACACSGIPRRDMEGLFQWTGVTPEARLALLAAVRPTAAIGERYQYSNLMLAAGGYAAAHRVAPTLPLAAAYAAAMHTHVFAPLGMTDATFDFARVLAGDHALPHALDAGGAVRAMPLEIERAVEPIAPAGGAWVTLRDMERFAFAELTALPGSRRVQQTTAIDEHSAYGLGYRITREYGPETYVHDGGSFGFGTTLAVLPAQRVAIVILSNVRAGNDVEHLPFVAAMRQRIIDEVTGSERAEPLLAEFIGKVAPERPHVMGERAAWLPALVGRYHEPLLGDVEITAAGVLDVGEWRSRIDRVVDGDTVRLVLLDPPFAGPSVVVGPGPSLIVPDEPTYTFTRVMVSPPK